MQETTRVTARKKPKTPDPRQQLAKVRGNPAQKRIDCGSAGSFEWISLQPMLALHTTERRLNGDTPFYQLPQPFWNRSAAELIDTH